MKIEEIKTNFIELIRSHVDSTNRSEVYLSEKVLRENALGSDTFWEVACPSLEKEGWLTHYSNPHDGFSTFGLYVAEDAEYKLESRKLREIEQSKLHFYYRELDIYKKKSDTQIKSCRNKLQNIENKLLNNFRHKFVINRDFFVLPKLKKQKINNLMKLKSELQTGLLVAYEDGTIRYKSKIIELRPQIKDLCRLFMRYPNALVTVDEMKDQIISSTKIEHTPFDTISKYVGELRTELKKHFEKKVIFNQPKEGWIFNP